MRKQEFTRYLANDQFEDLFIELGWNDYDGDRLLYPTDVDGTSFDFYVVAQQSGFMVLKCEVSELPTTALYKKLDTQIRKSAHEYLCIYYVPGKMRQMWIVPVDKVDKRDLVSVKYEDAAHAEFLYEKVEGFTFPIGEATNILDVKQKVQQAFIVNSEKLTKKFYDEFKKQHKAFEEFIDGIQSADDRRWYTSIMLDRLMFCYFIQKKGFLDNNKNYLQDKLRQVQAEEGDDEFYAFYRDFLCHLFRDGLNTPKHSETFEHRFGRIPYLNGGMFDVHPLEKKYNDIQIKDEAFTRLFNFFDQWEWHLDTRISSSGRDINPDVLGYIFEQFINDRAQMGAYYTKEDITGYIGRNTIIPFIFDKVKAKMPQLFVHGGKVWQFLQQSGERYVYSAVRKGYSADWREKIPHDIAVGLDTAKPDLLERRSHWNERTSEEFALPTEIWRETIERLQRCEDTLKKISSGEIENINDFITLNLDIRGFAYDLLEQTDDHLLVRNFYHSLKNITILDPTCGSGAFLFAAMNILEPLYEICIARMQDFQADNKNLFKDELGEISNKYRSNIQYFIFKSIILRNLYGVDIMAEAIEIAKLRLFLKMVAVVDVDMRADNLGLDPLPDIDFNIRCGNTLVGYATEKQLEDSITFGDMFARQDFKERIQQKLDIVSKTYDTFKWLQMNQQDNREAFKEAKRQLHDKLASLNEDLNQHLYGHKPDLGYAPWLDRTQPFHWVAEFYEIMHNGGFDVIIGNPPYVEYFKKDKKTGVSISDLYTLPNYKTIECGNLYAYVMERNTTLLKVEGKSGMIIPHSSICTDRMQPIINLFSNMSYWLSSYDIRPAKLFDGVDQRVLIYISDNTSRCKYVSKYYRWAAEYRPFLFDNVSYIHDFNKSLVPNSIPKIYSSIEYGILSKLSFNHPSALMGGAGYKLYYHNAPRYWIRATDFIPYFHNDKGATISSQVKSSTFITENTRDIMMGVLNSSLFYIWFVVYSDSRHLNSREIDNFPLAEGKADLKQLLSELSEDYQRNKIRKHTYYKATGNVDYDEYYPKKSKPIIDEIDKVLAKHYGFTDEELDFIINYDIKYRMGDELNE